MGNEMGRGLIPGFGLSPIMLNASNKTVAGASFKIPAHGASISAAISPSSYQTFGRKEMGTSR